jgi:hypothetical protein
MLGRLTHVTRGPVVGCTNVLAAPSSFARLLIQSAVFSWKSSGSAHHTFLSLRPYVFLIRVEDTVHHPVDRQR